MAKLLSLAFTIGLAGTAFSLASAQETVNPLHTHRPAHAVERPAREQSPESMFKPYAHPGEGDDDGLSHNPDDCMKGCIGGNPG